MDGIIDIDEIKEQLRKNLKSTRQQIGIRTLDVADYLGMSSAAYSYYESGRSVPTLDKLLKLGALYNKGIDELIGWQEIMLKNIEFNRYNADFLYEMQRASEFKNLYEEKLNHLSNPALREWIEEELDELSENQVQQLRLLWEILKLKEQQEES